MCIKRLKDAGLFMVTDLGDAAPSGAAPSNNPAASPQLPPAAKSPPNSGQDAMGRRMERMMPLVSLAVADSILGYVGAAITNGMQRLARDTPLRIDRVQAARLYAGMLEVSQLKAWDADVYVSDCRKVGMSHASGQPGPG